ncbi:MAG: CDP-diacylglycerol--glycerol-3-phosphate 3-phosphatidyltransferase [Planctomycetes bacterium]|nr:CDP-diacylglycerol--glycerol-3-phosphate 3-phosphatidyltransferase [Planctomycetota bacterium]
MRGEPASAAVWTVPNLLSLARLALSIAVFVLIKQRADLAATAVFLMASATDWVDGWYARRFGQVSRLGRIFDPLVDKVLVCGAVILVAEDAGPLFPWMAVVIVARELVVTAIRAEMERSGTDFSAGGSGKLKMLLQCAAVALVLTARAWPAYAIGGIPLTAFASWAAWAAIVATAWSGLEYLWQARSLVR